MSTILAIIGAVGSVAKIIGFVIDLTKKTEVQKEQEIIEANQKAEDKFEHTGRPN